MKTGLQNRSAQPEVAEEGPEHASSCLLGVGSLMTISVGIVAGNSVVAGSGAILAGLLVLSRLAADLRSGVTSSNYGTWQRHEHRLGFRRNVCFWGAIALLWFVLGTLLMFGILPGVLR